MWPFRKKESYLEKLRGYKKITVGGMRFTIKKINPLLDFKSESIPQIFTDFSSIKDKPVVANTPELIKKYQQDLYSVIQAGVVDPIISKDHITAEDLFRIPEIGVELYRLILEHSFNQFKGLKKLFFSIKTKYITYITWRKHTGYYRAAFYSRMKTHPS